VKVVNDDLSSKDGVIVTSLVLVDLLAAFDTVSHNFLLSRIDTNAVVKRHSAVLVLILPLWL